MQILENKKELSIISVIILVTTIIFTYAKFNFTFQNQKGIILHVLQNKTIELELQLTNMVRTAEDQIKYIAHNISFSKDPSKLLRQKQLNNEISIAIIDKNNKVVTQSKNFDKGILNKYFAKQFKSLNKVKQDDVNWYYGNNIGNKILATSKDSAKLYKIIFLLDINKTLQNASKISKSSGEFIKNFDFAVVDSQQNLISTTNSDWFQKINPQILKNFVDKKYQLKSKLYQFSGENYFIRKMTQIPNVSIMVMAEKQNIIENSLRVMLIRVLEIIVGLIGVILLILLIFRDYMLKNKLAKAYHSAQKANQVKSEFLNFVAHEIKSPLSCVTTSAALMRQRVFGEQLKDYDYYIGSMFEHSNLIIEFVDDILDENLILQSKFKLIKKLCKLQDIVSKSIAINNIRYKHLKIELVNNITDDFPEVLCDEKRMLQILNNLISNAMKFSPNNSSVTISSKMEDSNNFSISVADKGFGMDKDEIERLFNKVANNTNHNEDLESYGIGFKIIQILIEAHGGLISINSKIGLGTNVTITFPMSDLRK